MKLRIVLLLVAATTSMTAQSTGRHDARRDDQLRGDEHLRRRDARYRRLSSRARWCIRRASARPKKGASCRSIAISDPKVTTPEAARRLGRPIVFVQANIHAGEVEGKEAMLDAGAAPGRRAICKPTDSGRWCC